MVKLGNMDDQKLKKEADILMKIKGLTRGTEIESFATYIKKKYGEEALLKIQNKLKEIGYPVDFNKIKPLDFYQEALWALAIHTARSVLNWRDEDLIELGHGSIIFSLGIRLFVKFISRDYVAREASKIWRKITLVGDLEVVFNEKNNCATVRLKNYKFHPDLCLCYMGIFKRLGQYLIGKEEINVKEIKCAHKEDPYHEFLITWS